MSIAIKLGLEHEDGCGPSRAPLKEIQKFEAYFEFTLPSLYRDMLREVNGGLPRLKRVRVNRRILATINAFFFLGEQHQIISDDEGWDHENLWDESIVARRSLRLPMVPFANDGAGGLFTFLADKSGAVFLVDSTNAQNIDLLAEDFQTFVAALVA
jgi:hypothetical protein